MSLGNTQEPKGDGEQDPDLAPPPWKSRIVIGVVGSSVWSRLLAVVLALIIAIPVLIVAGADPLNAYLDMLRGTFGSMRGFGDVLARADTFILLGLGIAVCVRAGFFNIGAEGQLWLGALGATIVALYIDGPPVLIIPLALSAGFIFGAVWSGLVAALKITLGVDELISSLMLNYVAILLIAFLTFGPMKAYRAGQTERIPDDVFLPTLIPGTRLHVGFLIAVAAVIIVWIVLNRTTFGFEIRSTGGNPQAARFVGIRVNRVFMRVSLLGGGFCGLAGANVILGAQHVLLATMSPGWGYTSIAVVLLGGLTPLGILLSAILFGVLEIGATTMQYASGVPAAVGAFIEGLILIIFLMAIPVTLRSKKISSLLRLRRGGVDK